MTNKLEARLKHGTKKGSDSVLAWDRLPRNSEILRIPEKFPFFIPAKINVRIRKLLHNVEQYHAFTAMSFPALSDVRYASVGPFSKRVT